MKSRRPYALLLLALFLSGASGLMNQIAWQRAVKVYLGNSETLSATLVVLVFMLGLGMGSLFAARTVPQLTHPFRRLAWVELSLFLVNGALIFAFGPELRSYDHALLISATEAGIPAAVVYGLMSFVVLILPCFLMGLTIPLAAEAAQRQLAVQKKKAVSDFFFLNTVGAVVGTLGCGLLLMPMFGQKVAMAVAALGNLLAGLLVLIWLSRLPAVAPQQDERSQEPPAARTPLTKRPIQNELVLAFVLGALSLSYEIYLFRIVALAYTPLPWIFCVVLCFFLLFWSIGVAVSERTASKMSSTLLLTAISVAAVPFVVAYQRYHAASFPIWSFGLIYFLPCIGFGMLFGMTIGRYAKQWGRDVGVFTALNTAGAGVGILATTFLLFEIDKDLDAWILSMCLAVFIPYFYAREQPTFRWARVFNTLAGAGLALVLLVAAARVGPNASAQRAEFYGRDGVVEIDRNNLVYIDGLWHSVLYRDNDRRAKQQENVRRKMLIAILPFLAHSGSQRVSVLNVGMGTGATARTLAKSSSVESVDAYEIVNTIREVIDSYPEYTLKPSELQKIHVYWEDARSGLIRRDKKYDIITQSPLYLKQTGSSLLLSREYFELLKSRLKEGGIAGIYCNSQGNQEQALLVRKTVSEVFEYYESFANGYFILASDRPIRIDKARFEAKLVEGDPIAEDVRILGIDFILAGIDRPRLDWTSSPYVITDDHPLVEHPEMVRWLFGRQRPGSSAQ
jgi:spermidine synthase